MLILRVALAAVLMLAAAPATAGARNVWLCKPGLKDNPCDVRLDIARYTPDGQLLGGDDPTPARRRRVDCFYVYPTVSDQPTRTATRRIDPEIRSIVRWQAARYGRTCRLFAPVYRQVTLVGLTTAEPAQWRRAYRDVRAAWRTYLARHNRGRGVVLIGHSQGTYHLTKLLAREIEGSPRVRRRLVSAILLGGHVTVAEGRDVGGSFRRVRACRSRAQIGCVVAFNTFGEPAPPDAEFGRAARGRDVLCTNPAELGGGDAALDAIVPHEPLAPGTGIAAAFAGLGFSVPASSATWLAFPDAYSGRCVDEGGANVLRIAGAPGAPALRPQPLPSWGLHLVDANIALGDLERLVRGQVAAYLR